MSEQEYEQNKRARSQRGSSEEVEDEEEEDEEEEDEVEETETQLMTATKEEKAKIVKVQEFLGRKVSTIKCLRELRRCQGNVENTITAFLDESNPEADDDWKEESGLERERRELTEKIDELYRNGPDAVDSCCSSVRHRLLWGDNRVAWMEGACAVALCYRSLLQAEGDVDFLSRPQTLFLGDCLSRATAIMLDQDIPPSGENYQSAITVIHNAMEIAILALLKGNDARYVDVLAMVLDSQRNIWTADKDGIEYHKRYSRISTDVALSEAIIGCLTKAWLGSEAVGSILAIFRHLDQSERVVPIVREKLKTVGAAEQSLKNDRALEYVFKELLMVHATEEDIEADDGAEEDVVTPQYADLRSQRRQERREEFFFFWFKDVALRLFNTSNLEQRLFGLSQIERLLDSTGYLSGSPGFTPLGERRTSVALTTSRFAPHGTRTRPGSSTTITSLRDRESELSHEKLALWLLQSDFYHLLVDENRIHSEIISRSRRVVRFLVAASAIQPQLFPVSHFLDLWRVALSQHESVTLVILEILVDVFEDCPRDGRLAADIIRFLTTLPPDQCPLVVELLKCVKRRSNLGFLVCTSERSDLTLEMLWTTLGKLDDENAEAGLALFVALLLTENGRKKRGYYASRCVQDIQRALLDKSNNSFQRLVTLRRILDCDQTSSTTSSVDAAERVGVLRELHELLGPSFDIVQLLIHDLAVPRNEVNEHLTFRLEMIVSTAKQVSFMNKDESSPFLSLDQIQRICSLIPPGGEETKFLLLNQILKAGRLKLSHICEVFNRLVCPAWKSLCASELMTRASESIENTLMAWNCFKEYFEEMKRYREGASDVLESSLRIARECLWEAALAPFAPPLISESAIKLAIQETNHLNDVLHKILSRLRAAESALKLNSGDASARGVACRCLAILCRFAESDRNVQFDSEPLPHGITQAGSPIKLQIALNYPAEVGQPHSPQQTISFDVTTNLSVRDAVSLLKKELNVAHLSLALGNHDVTGKWWMTLEHFLSSGSTVHGVCVVPSRSSMLSKPHPSTSKEPTMESARMALARSDSLYDLLHEFQALGERLGEIKPELMALLNVLPSRRSLVALLPSADCDSEFWSSLFSTPNHACNVYRLEVASALLSPSDPLAVEASKSFRARFASMGGLHATVEFLDKTLLQKVEPFEVFFQGTGVRTALKVIGTCNKELVQRKDDLETCLGRFREILAVPEDMEAAGAEQSLSPITQLMRTWGKDVAASIRNSALHSTFLLANLMDSVTPAIESLVKVIVQLLRTSEIPPIRVMSARLLETLARNPVHGQTIWTALSSDLSWNHKPESFRPLWVIWDSKKPASTDAVDGARIVNQVLGFARKIMTEPVGSLRGGSIEVSLYFLFDLVVHMMFRNPSLTTMALMSAPSSPNPATAPISFGPNPEPGHVHSVASVASSSPYQHSPNVAGSEPPPPPPSLGLTNHNVSFGRQRVHVGMVQDPEAVIGWLVDDVLFSKTISRSKQLLHLAQMIIMLMCQADPGSPTSAATALKCRRLLYDRLRRKMEKTEKISEWSFDSEQMLRSPDSNFVGLVNQGATCYMNSLLQQFFASPMLRSWILTKGSLEKDHLRSVEGIEPEKQQQACEVMRQIRRVFHSLNRSARRCIDPKDLVEACKTLNLSNPVHHQNDSRDLCDKLVDRIEIAMKSMGYDHPTQMCFGGRVIHQNIKRGCPHAPTERADDFIALELQIKGKNDLESSLREFCAGEVLDGENRVKCDECNQKYPALLRDCLADTLPKVLVLHLKRFELDYDTFETVKVNDRLSFPLKLDVGPFTRDGLIRAEKNEPLSPRLYNLCGVLVHRGVAGGGHYYSFAKDQLTGKWYRFNDERVTPFDVKKLSEECFGGKTDQHGAIDGDTSAYMLFYEKIEEETGEEATKDQTAAAGTETPVGAAAAGPQEDLSAEVDDDNATLASQLVLGSSDLADTLTSLLHHRVVTSSTSQEDLVAIRSSLGDLEPDKIESDLAMLSFDLCLDWLVRTSHVEPFERLVETFLSLAQQQPQWVPEQLLLRVTDRLRDTVTKCRNSSIRKAFLRIPSICGGLLHSGFYSLAGLLDALLDLLPDASKSLRYLSDVLHALREMLAHSPSARALMRGEVLSDGASVAHGLIRLIHFALGGGDSPFTERPLLASSASIQSLINTSTPPTTVMLIDPPSPPPHPPPAHQPLSSTTVQLREDTEVLVVDEDVQKRQIGGDTSDDPVILIETEDEDLSDGSEQLIHQPRFPPFDWTWSDRLVRWNASALSAPMALMNLTTGGGRDPLAGHVGHPAGLSGTMLSSPAYMAFETLVECIGEIASPISALPAVVQPLFAEPSGPLYNLAVKEGGFPMAVKSWLVDLCERDVQGVQRPASFESSRSFTVISDLLSFVTKPLTVFNNNEVESFRYDAAAKALGAVLAIEDEWQFNRINFAIKGSAVSGANSPRSQLLNTSGSKIALSGLGSATEGTVTASSTTPVPRVQGLLMCCQSQLRRYWGPVTPLNPSAFHQPGGTGTTSSHHEDKAYLMMSVPESLHCERHIRALSQIANEVPAFKEALKRSAEQQRREVCYGDDELTRLVYWFAHRSFELYIAGGGVDHGNRHLQELRMGKKRSAESDAILQTMAPLGGISPAEFVTGRQWRQTDPFILDAHGRFELGPHHLFDDKSQYAVAYAYVVDVPVKKPSVVVEFNARMGMQYCSQLSQKQSQSGEGGGGDRSSSEEVNDRFYCIVVGKRPGDSTIRMRDDAVASGGTELRLFDRVAVRMSDVLKSRTDMKKKEPTATAIRSPMVPTTRIGVGQQQQTGTSPTAAKQPASEDDEVKDPMSLVTESEGQVQHESPRKKLIKVTTIADDEEEDAYEDDDEADAGSLKGELGEDQEEQEDDEEPSSPSSTVVTAALLETPTKKARMTATENESTTQVEPGSSPRLHQHAGTTPKTTTVKRTETSMMPSTPASSKGELYGVIIKILPAGTESKRRRVVVRLDTSSGETGSGHSQLIELGEEIPQDDPLVVEMSEDLVSLSNEQLCVTDHPFTISRLAPVPYFNPRDCKVVHTRQLEIPIFPGERVGVARSAQLGLAWCKWQGFDPKAFNYFYAPQNIVIREGAVLAHNLVHEIGARPAFNFKIAPTT